MSDLRRMLKQFLSGKESPRGKDLYDTWYRSFDDTGAPENSNPAEIEQELAHIKQRPVKQAETSRSLLPYWRAAAAVLLVAVCGVYLYRMMSRSPEMEDYTVYTTGTGERRQVVLADGTGVWLNAGSQLRASKTFDGDKREVFLSGEGYFEVTRNPDKPFIIHTGKLTTTVLGTVFNVRSYTNEQLEEVAVVSGKVSVAYNDRTALLTRGRKVILTGEILGEGSFDDFDRYTTWKDGKLVLENRPVNEVLQTVNRFYGVDIRVRGGNLGSCLISTTLEPMPEQELTDLLCLLLNAKAQKEGPTYWISGNGCNE